MRGQVKTLIVKTLIGAGFTAGLLMTGPARAEINLTPIGSYGSGLFDGSSAEIPTYDAANKRLYVTNAEFKTLDVLDLADPTRPTLIQQFFVGGGGPNSVAFGNGLIATAVENSTRTSAGSVKFYDSNSLLLVGEVGVGALPDMLTFTPDGMKLLVANEGEPSADYTIDPNGSVSIIDLSAGVGAATVTTADFNGVPVATGVRIFGPGASVSQDLEPEYIAVSPDGSTAYVSLQENNALGILDLGTNAFTSVESLGFKDHSLPSQGLDANKNDDAAVIENLPIFGMYQPDAIAAYAANGQTFVVTANEGDAREYIDDNDNEIFIEEADLKDIDLDPAVFSEAFRLRAKDTNDIGDLKITTTLGNTDNDAEYEEIYAFGGRSFSILDAQGNLVFDSGDDFEQITADLAASDPDFVFNATNDENDSFDNRSDNKGPEPEGLTLGQIGSQTYAFIGLERVGGIMVYDITDPDDPSFVQYLNPRDFTVPDSNLEDAVVAAQGTFTDEFGSLDLGPEGLLFISAADSPTGIPLLVVTNEVSGTTTIFAVPEPGVGLSLLALGSLLAVRRRTAA